MKHRAYWLCAATATAVAIGVFYFYGLSLATFMIALLVLICPVLVVWLTLRIAKRSEEEIDACVRKETKNREKT